MSRRTFYELFSDREDCFLAAFDHALERATSVVVPAYEAQSGWRERVRAGLLALLEFLEEEPGLGRLLVVEALGAGPRALERRARVLDALIEIVDRGRVEGRVEQEEQPRLIAEGVVGAAFDVIHTRVLEHDPGARGSLMELANPLMSMIVMPYVGTAAARRELRKPAPRGRSGAVRRRQDPLKDLDMRLTYRTVRVLMAIAASPGISNRQVADAAEVGDQGQISKLLSRLDSLGLVRNTAHGHPKGEPNHWTLTPKGHQVEQAIRGQVEQAGR
jgi:AcrR family transcriptional regulator/DNA-binding MarR family transcriptional regulator